MQRLFFCLVAVISLTKSKGATEDDYIRVLQNTLKQYHCHYEMTYSITGQNPILSKGIMASASGLLYDSSNLHLILKNPQWLVSVDFLSDFISVVKNNPAKSNTYFNQSSQFLVSNDFFDKNAVYKIRKQTQERIWIAVSFKTSSPVKDLVIEFEKLSQKVISISMEMEQLIAKNEDGDQRANIRLHLSQIAGQLPAGLFNEKRFFRENGKKIILNKYTQYQLSYNSL